MNAGDLLLSISLIESIISFNTIGSSQIFYLNLLTQAEEARHIGVVCKYLHVAQPKVGINISLSDESDGSLHQILQIFIFNVDRLRML
jgi:hypothetical protein